MSSGAADPATNEVRGRPKWPWVAVIAVVLFGVSVVVGGLFRPYVFKGTIIQSSAKAPAMEGLVYSDGQPVDMSAFEGEVVLIYFGYTYCPDLCPTMLATIDRAVVELGEEGGRVKTMMVTVDPARDTMEGVGDYVRLFNDEFLGVWGSENEVRSVATLYGSTFELEDPESDGSYLVSHTASLLAIDRDGVLRLVYPVGVTSQELTSDLRELLR